MPETLKELQVVPWWAKWMESDLRLYICIPPRLPSLQHRHPPRIYTSPLPQFQWPCAMVALLPNSPMPHHCACQVGKKLEVPPAGTVLWVRRTRVLPSTGYCKGWAEQGAVEHSLPAPQLFCPLAVRGNSGSLHPPPFLSKLVQTEWAQSYQRVLPNRPKCKQIVQ